MRLINAQPTISFEKMESDSVKQAQLVKRISQYESYGVPKVQGVSRKLLPKLSRSEVQKQKSSAVAKE